MPENSVEERLDRLEKVVDQVLSQLADDTLRHKNWRRTVGMFDDNPGMKEIIDGALRSREEERVRFYDEHDRQNGKS